MVSAQTTLRQGWLARAVLSGFVATVLMILAAVVAYGIAYVLANIEPSEQAGAQTYSAWFKGLTDNIIVEYTTDIFYAAIAIHLAIGLGFALIYAYFVEPRIPGTDLGRGLAFAFFPWVLSLVAFLPLVGAGFFGLGLDAGFLPILGNLVLHIVYGAALGLVYGSFGDTVDAENPRLCSGYGRRHRSHGVVGAHGCPWHCGRHRGRRRHRPHSGGNCGHQRLSGDDESAVGGLCARLRGDGRAPSAR